MWLNIFKISIILSVTATAVDESVLTKILRVLRERKATNSNGDVDLHLYPVLYNSVVETFFNYTILRAKLSNTRISVDYDGALRNKIVKFLIEYPKKKTATPIDERLLQDIYNILIEHSNRTTAPFIKFLKKSYNISDEKVTWYEANKTCVYMGASLISREENDESTLLLQFLKVTFDRTWWVSFNGKLGDSLCPFLGRRNGKGGFLNGATKCHYSSHFICEK